MRRRPSRERQALVGERTRLINPSEGQSRRLGIRGFRPIWLERQASLKPCARRRASSSDEHVGRDAARPGSPALRQAADQGDREDPRRSSGEDARRATPCVGARPHAGGRRRDRGHACPGGVLAADQGQQGAGPLCRAHRSSRRHGRRFRAYREQLGACEKIPAHRGLPCPVAKLKDIKKTSTRQ